MHRRPVTSHHPGTPYSFHGLEIIRRPFIEVQQIYSRQTLRVSEVSVHPPPFKPSTQSHQLKGSGTGAMRHLQNSCKVREVTFQHEKGLPVRPTVRILWNRRTFISFSQSTERCFAPTGQCTEARYNVYRTGVIRGDVVSGSVDVRENLIKSTGVHVAPGAGINQRRRAISTTCTILSVDTSVHQRQADLVTRRRLALDVQHKNGVSRRRARKSHRDRNDIPSYSPDVTMPCGSSSNNLDTRRHTIHKRHMGTHRDVQCRCDRPSCVRDRGCRTRDNSLDAEGLGGQLCGKS